MPDEVQGLACMEIRGGNVALRQRVDAPGLVGWIDSVPYQQAAGGGDVYYMSNCATGRITRILLADVSGHGAAVSGIAERLRTLMRRYVNHVSQGGFVRALNAEFANVMSAGGFATAVAATYFAPERTLAFCLAGHPPPLVRRKHRWRAFDPDAGESSASGLPLGLLDEGEYGEAELQLEVGDMAVLYSDAWIEARGVDGEQLGVAGLLDVLKSVPDGTPEQTGDALRQAVALLHPENLLDDDATLVVVQATAGGEKVPFRNRMLAPWRLLGGIGRALRAGGRGFPIPEFSVRNLGGSLFDRFSHRHRPTRKG